MSSDCKPNEGGFIRFVPSGKCKSTYRIGSVRVASGLICQRYRPVNWILVRYSSINVILDSGAFVTMCAHCHCASSCVFVYLRQNAIVIGE